MSDGDVKDEMVCGKCGSDMKLFAPDSTVYRTTTFHCPECGRTATLIPSSMAMTAEPVWAIVDPERSGSGSGSG